MALYPWLESTLADWSRAIEQQAVPASTMLVSSAGMGSDALIRQMAASVLCKNGSTPCGFCHACHLFAADNHPDFHWIEPEKNAKSISVEQIRAVNRLAQESSQLGGFRVIAISPAQAMNESAANALLKTLEEPPGDCCFILSVNQVSRLLPTIVSRCRQIHLPQLTQDQVAHWASQQLGETVSPFVVKLNGFSPLAVIEFIQTKQNLEFEKLAAGFIAFLQQPDNQLIDFSKQINQQAELHLTWLWYLLTDAQKYHFSIDQIDSIPHSANVSQLCAYPVLHQQTQSLSHLIQQLKQFAGLNSELLIIDWLLNFKG
jgi:DNA polymerase-3 subunit delta'